MKKIFLLIISIVMVFTLTACGKDKKEEVSNKDNNTSQKEDIVEPNKQQEENKSVIIDDEIIDIDDEDNEPPANVGSERVDEVINCSGCVFAYFSGEGEQAKRLGGTITSSEYTTDALTLKTAGSKQRHNFFGLVLEGNTIVRAYSCILKDNKIYCIEGSTNGAYHKSNISILNMIFKADDCRTISDGHTYTCSDGYYNGDTKTNGYTSLHYETSCTIYGGDSGNAGKLICH